VKVTVEFSRAANAEATGAVLLSPSFPPPNGKLGVGTRTCQWQTNSAPRYYE